MIPKKIHFCWLSGDSYPKKNRNCIRSWEKILPDYEFVKWDKEKIPLMDGSWVREAFENKKYAFAADYIRLFALYNEGGIYLDTDVEVRRSYNDLLTMPYFLGCECTTNIVEAATIGTEARAPWVKEVLDHYAGRRFVRPDGSFDTEPLPQIMRDTFQKIRGMKFINKPTDFDPHESSMQLLPVEYFSPKHWDSLEVYATKNTYSIHQFAGSWLPVEPLSKRMPKEIKAKVKSLLGQSAVLRIHLICSKIKTLLRKF